MIDAPDEGEKEVALWHAHPAPLPAADPGGLGIRNVHGAVGVFGPGGGDCILRLPNACTGGSKKRPSPIPGDPSPRAARQSTAEGEKREVMGYRKYNKTI